MNGDVNGGTPFYAFGRYSNCPFFAVNPEKKKNNQQVFVLQLIVPYNFRVSISLVLCRIVVYLQVAKSYTLTQKGNKSA